MTTRQLRADARRNLDRILGAAEQLLAERGPAVPMEEIARRAEVGVGTLYRRFPDRDALVDAVALRAFDRVLLTARAAVEEEDPWAGMVGFVRGAVADLRLASLLAMWFEASWGTMQQDPEHRRRRSELITLLERMITRAQQAGAIRDDVGAGDFGLLLALLLRPLPGYDDDRTAERNVALMLEALRPRPDPEPLPGSPPRLTQRCRSR